MNRSIKSKNILPTSVYPFTTTCLKRNSMNNEDWRNAWESAAHISIRMNVHLIAELDRRRKQWGLKSRGAVLEHLLGWMVEEKGPTEEEPF